MLLLLVQKLSKFHTSKYRCSQHPINALYPGKFMDVFLYSTTFGKQILDNLSGFLQAVIFHFL